MGDIVHEPYIDRKPEQGQEAGYFCRVLLNFIFEVFFTDNVYRALGGAGLCHVRERAEGIVYPLFKNTPQKSSCRDRNDRDSPVHPADGTGSGADGSADTRQRVTAAVG